LTRISDDGIVIVERAGDDMMVKTMQLLEDLFDPNKQEDGSWRAEFHGPIDVHAEGRTLAECRRRMDDAFDQQIALWLVGKRAQGRRRRRGRDQPAERVEN